MSPKQPAHTTYKFNEQNAANISDMKHIAFMNTNLNITGKVMEPFNVMFPTGYFVQPSPLGATFFHASTEHIETNTAMQIEKEIFTNVQGDLPIDLFIITAMNTRSGEGEDISKHVRAAKEIAPESKIVILSYNPAKTSEALKNAGLGGEVSDDNIISTSELNRGKSNLLIEKLKRNTGMFDTPYVNDKQSYYSHAVQLRSQYYEIESIEESPEIAIKRAELNQLSQDVG